MSRLRADALLLFAAIIWGTAFIAQKTGMQGLGPMGFVGLRFALSFLVVLPFALREEKREIPRGTWVSCIPLCLFFFCGVAFQQIGLLSINVTNAGFLTALYVIFTPLAAWAFYKKRPTTIIALACLLAMLGAYFLGGGKLAAFHAGDFWVIGSALAYAAQIAMVGHMVQRVARPMFFVLLQYGVCAALGLLAALQFETLSFDAIMVNAMPLLYAGVISGGVAYTIQVVAQQYAPASDAAIIMSTEALFAAISGVILLGDHLPVMGWIGCALIFGAVLVVEAGLVFRHFRA